MSVASSKVTLALKETTFKYNNQQSFPKQDSPTKVLKKNLIIKTQINRFKAATAQNENQVAQKEQSNISQTQQQQQTSQVNINSSFHYNNKVPSSRHTSGPNTCIKVNNNKHSSQRYSGSPQNNEFFEDEEEHIEDYEKCKSINTSNPINNSELQMKDLEDSQIQNDYSHDEFENSLKLNDYKNREVLKQSIDIKNQDHDTNLPNFQNELQNFISSKNVNSKSLHNQKINHLRKNTINNNNFLYQEQEQQNSRQLLAGNTIQEEAFLFDSLNSLVQQSDKKHQNQGSISQQMQITLKQAVANFAQEKQVQKQLNDLQLKNQQLSDENQTLKQQLSMKEQDNTELRIQLKELEIRLSHAESQIKREQQEKESNALAFKRILANITSAQNKDQKQCYQSSTKKFNSRKLSQQMEPTQNSLVSQSTYFKFMQQPDINFGQCGTIGALTKTLDNDTLVEQNTLDQISKLKHQLTFKEEELKHLRKQHRRAGNQSVWWFNNRGQQSIHNFNQSGSNGYSPLPTQPSMPSQYYNPLADQQKSFKNEKKYQQQYQLLSPAQGSPILSNHGSLNSWINQKLTNKSIGQFQLQREEVRPSQTEVIADENSFEHNSDNAKREMFTQQIDITDYSNPQIIKKSELQDQSDLIVGEEDEGDLAVECMNEERKLEMIISGGDYSPNSHTFFKHPFKNENENTQDQKLIVLHKCQKVKEHNPSKKAQSAQMHGRKLDQLNQHTKNNSQYGSIMSTKAKQQTHINKQSPLIMFNKCAQSKQASRKHSPMNSNMQLLKDHHQTLDNSDLSFNQQIQQQQQQNERQSLGLGPHNTLGTTMVTTTNGNNTSNISPYKEGKRLIPDSLVKMSKFISNKNNENQRMLNISNYQTINR